MSKVKCIIEMDEDEYKRVKNAECSYDGFEKGTFGYYLNIIQKTATLITESDDAVSREAVLEIVEENDIIYDAAYRIGKGVKALPSVLPKREHGEWIKADKLIKSLRDSCEGFWRKKMLINGEPLSEALSFELNTIERCIKDLKDVEMR